MRLLLHSDEVVCWDGGYIDIRAVAGLLVSGMPLLYRVRLRIFERLGGRLREILDSCNSVRKVLLVAHGKEPDVLLKSDGDSGVLPRDWWRGLPGDVEVFVFACWSSEYYDSNSLRDVGIRYLCFSGLVEFYKGTPAALSLMRATLRRLGRTFACTSAFDHGLLTAIKDTYDRLIDHANRPEYGTSGRFVALMLGMQQQQVRLRGSGAQEVYNEPSYRGG